MFLLWMTWSRWPSSSWQSSWWRWASPGGGWSLPRPSCGRRPRQSSASQSRLAFYCTTSKKGQQGFLSSTSSLASLASTAKRVKKGVSDGFQENDGVIFAFSCQVSVSPWMILLMMMMMMKIEIITMMMMTKMKINMMTMTMHCNGGPMQWKDQISQPLKCPLL